MTQGWIKLHRKILDNPITCKDTEYFAIWCYLLLNAAHHEYEATFKGQKITLKKGQLITGRKKISEHFSINESKVQRVLKKLENEQQIEQQTSNKKRLITIKNWDMYQAIEQQEEQLVNNKRTTTEQQLNTNKNIKNIKNIKNVENYHHISDVDDKGLTLDMNCILILAELGGISQSYYLHYARIIWLNKLGFTCEQIHVACEKAKKAGKTSIEAIESILKHNYSMTAGGL